MAKDKRKSKYVPTFQAASDDLVVLDEEGNEHRPHEGEWVRFRKGVPMSIMRLVAKAAQIEDLPDDAGEAEREAATLQYAEVSEGIVKALAHQVYAWSWTDDDYAPLPSPREDREAFVECLWQLEDYEIAWLQEHLTDGANISKN